jgi:hypothetical protein
MKSYTSPLAAILAILVAASCEKEVYLDLPAQHGQYLIVEANLTDHRAFQEIRLYRSASFYDIEKGSFVSGAKVVVTGTSGDFVFQESTSARHKGHYRNYKIFSNLKAGETYQLIVESDNEVYTAQSQLQPVPVVDSITVKKNIISGIGIVDGPLYDIYGHFPNLKGLNYYLVNIFVNIEIKTFTPQKKTVISDSGLDTYTSTYVRTINGDDVQPGDTLTMQLRSISRGQYDFYSDFLTQTELSGNPFAGAPPANVPTNLSEGALGFFQVSSVSEASIIFKEDN